MLYIFSTVLMWLLKDFKWHNLNIENIYVFSVLYLCFIWDKSDNENIISTYVIWKKISWRNAKYSLGSIEMSYLSLDYMLTILICYDV